MKDECICMRYMKLKLTTVDRKCELEKNMQYSYDISLFYIDSLGMVGV